uniref:Uncharacterized protein LOC116950381 n=1 Tax=Petromyzon marinus TaxID=7757 RepID=A0AAJ7TVU9_PETMA|nr:uncharacterized protein LOC116950381 [Petromyzon marinus]
MTQPPRSMPGNVGCAPPGSRGLRLQSPDEGVACATSPAPVGSSGPRLPTSSLPCSTAALSVPPQPLSGTYCSFVCTPGLEPRTQMKRMSSPPPRPQCSDGSDGATAGTTLLKEPRSVANWCAALANATSMATVTLPLQLMSPPPIQRSANSPLHTVMPATHVVPLEQNGPEHAPAIPCNVGSGQRQVGLQDSKLVSRHHHQPWSADFWIKAASTTSPSLVVPVILKFALLLCGEHSRVDALL